VSTVTAITPNLGAVGDSVTITGTGFGAAQGGSTVSFGGVAVASYTSWSDTSIVVVVPAATPSGRVVVTVSGAVQADYKASWFEIRDSSVVSLYDAINGRLKAQDETNDSSPEDYRAADARDYNNALQLLANLFEGAGKKLMSGLRVAYASATTVTVEAGSAISSDGKYLLSLAALSTISIATAGAALGLDETTLTATCTTSASTSGTMSASIWSETAMTNTVKTLSGTITSVGTALTGSSTKFLSELAVGDVVRSSANGGSRVTAIASDTAATLVAAFPGGDVSGVAATSYENLTFWCDTAQSGDKRAVNTITHNGLTVVWTTASTSNGSGKTAKVGVEVASRWYFPWLVYGSSGTTVILSTQRTRPYSVTGYATAWRRLRARYNLSSGDLRADDQTGPPGCPYTVIDAPGAQARVLSAGVATAWTDVDCSAAAPPTANAVWARLIAVGGAGTQTTALARANGSPSPTNDCPLISNSIVNEVTNVYGPLPLKGGVIEYSLNVGGSSVQAYIDIHGYWEAL